MTSEEYGQYIDDFEMGIDVDPTETLTDYIERRRREFDSKADGGSIGIEVLFTDKMANGGRVPMLSGGALKTATSGIMKLFGKGDDAVDLAKQEEIFRSGDITTDFLEKVDDKVIKKFITTRDTGGPGGYGMYKNFDDMPNGLKAAELISRIKTADGGINYEAAELFIGKKLKGDETVDELIKMVIKKPGLTDSPLKDFENYVLKGDGAKDGGRVGLFMGGPALEGQALNIYNSMSGYGFTDQQIANALQGQGLYTPSGSSTPETTASNIIGSQLNQGGGGDNNFGGQGIGAFGNLDPNTLQTMQVEVADGKGGVTIKEVDTYLDAGGMRKTLDNKNPVNLGLDIKPMAVTIMESLMGKKNDLEFDPAGKIYGTFNNPNYKDLSFIGKIKADYSRQKELKQLQKEFELQEKLKKEIAAQEAQYGKINYGRGSDGQQSYDSGQGFGINATTGGPVSNRTGRGRTDYSKGGLATMFTRRR
jgi:hypothetical protein